MEGHNNATRLLEHKKDGVGGIEETVEQLRNTVENLKNTSHETEQKSVQLARENDDLKKSDRVYKLAAAILVVLVISAVAIFLGKDYI